MHLASQPSKIRVNSTKFTMFFPIFMSNIREVARLAGVSVATVSRSLANPEKVSPATLKKVRDVIKSLDYRPNLLARNFRASKSYSFIVLVPDITNSFFAEVINAIEDYAQQTGYAVLLGDTRESAEREQEYVNRVETRLADGIIQLRPHPLSTTSGNIPWVNACGCEATTGASVRIDNIAAFKTIVEHFIALGHTKIGIITGRRDNSHSIDRLEGYRQAINDAGLTFNNDHIIEGDFTIWSGQSAALAFSKMTNRPTAICCMNDEMAIGAIQTFKGQGLQVPENISIAGFDDINYAKFWDPGLTTIAQPAKEMGTKAAEMLINMIEGKDTSGCEIILPTRFIARQSTARIA